MANGLISLTNNRVTTLDLCKNVFFVNIFRFLIKFCICIDIYKILVWTVTFYFSFIFNTVLVLD